MPARFQNTRWAILSLGMFLIISLWLPAQRSRLTLDGIWIGQIPPEICPLQSSKYLLFTHKERWEAFVGDVGCTGRYQIDITAPHTLIINPQSPARTLFTYHVTNDGLTLQSSTGRTYLFTACRLPSGKPCPGGDY